MWKPCSGAELTYIYIHIHILIIINKCHTKKTRIEMVLRVQDTSEIYKQHCLQQAVMPEDTLMWMHLMWSACFSNHLTA